MVAHADRPARPLAAATRLVGGGRPARAPGASVSPELTLTSTYVAGADLNYARVGNPTWTAFEDVLGDLEGGQALAFASGMAAVSAVLHLTDVGAPVVVPDAAYNGTLALAQEWATAGRIELRPVPMADTDAVCAALDGAGLCWLETPTNPMLDVADLTAIAARARWVRHWLRARPERHIVVVCHGDCLRYITQGRNTYNPWANVEVREYTFAADEAEDADGEAWLVPVSEVAQGAEAEPTSSVAAS